VFLVNSRSCLFIVPTGFPGDPFSRSYGANLPSSLTIVDSLAFGYSPRARVFVLGTGNTIVFGRTKPRSFFKKQSIRYFGTQQAFPYLSHFKVSYFTMTVPRICLWYPSTCLDQLYQSLAYPNCLRHSFGNNTSTGILTCGPSTTLFSFALGPD
jgi:hypothetical protein